MIPYEERPYRPCVGVMLLNQGRQVFVAQRLDQSSDAWQMPQGGIDHGETPQEAVRRELLEEIGTDAAKIISESPEWLSYDIPRYLADTLWEGQFKGQTQKWFAMTFLGVDGDVNLKTAHPEFKDWKWVRASALPSLAVTFKRKNYEKVLSTFGHLFD